MSTLSDVAKKAGVAVSTASKVLSKSPAAGELTERTKAAVIRAARELKYRPHPIAHSLRTRKTATVGAYPTSGGSVGWCCQVTKSSLTYAMPQDG